MIPEVKMSVMAIPGIVRSIEEIAAEMWDTSVDLIKSKCRKREVKEARQVLMVFRMQVLRESSTKAALPYDLDHATALHAKKTIKDIRDTEKDFDLKCEEFYEKARCVVRHKRSTIAV